MTNGNDAAMPTDIWSESRNGGFLQEGTDPGLTKREYFAAMAMQGMLGNKMTTTAVIDAAVSNADRPALIAKVAVLHADALIAALNKEPK